VNDWLILDALVLFACVSMYLGTGWSLVLFSFPGAKKLTPANYYDQFVPQVTRATQFFTWMTSVMSVAAVVAIVWERSSWYVAAPAVVLASILAATGLTIKFIFPYNKRMAEHITDAAELQRVLGKWMSLNVIRVLLWTVQWIAMAVWLGVELG
jgi:hypothetical protein